MIKKYLFIIVVLAFIGTSCSSQYMSKENQKSNKEWVENFYKVNNEGDFTRLQKLIDKNYVEHEPLPGFSSNREGLLQFFKMMRTSFPDLKNEIDFMISENNRVVVYVTMSGTHKTEYFGIPPTNKKFSITVIDIIEIKNGKMTAHWGVGDYYTQYVQLGVISE